MCAYEKTAPVTRAADEFRRTNMKTEQDLNKIIENLNLPFTVAPLQYMDVLTAYRSGRFALFYDVGGGKTLVSTLIAMMFDYPTVVVMPHILIKQWQRWLKRALIPDSEVYVYYGPKRKATELTKHKWVLTSHAIFRQDKLKFREAYKGRKVTLLLDEAQVIKDVGSKIFKATEAFVGGENPFVPMSATPTAKPIDTYAYMKLKTPGLYRNLKHWEALHIDKVDIYGNPKSYANLDMLRDNFAINAAKRDKKDLFGYDLDPIIDPVPYELSPKHMALYRKLVEEQIYELPDGEKIDATTAQRMRHAMQQLVWNPAAFSGDPTDVATGFDLLDTLCEQVNFMPTDRSKFVIWTYYRQSTERIVEWMRSKFGNTGAVAYGGSNSEKAVEAVMFDDKCRWMVANPLSVGAGLELQHVCWEMFFAEMVTTPIPNRQAIGRVDRPGQKYRPTIRIGQAEGTIQLQLFKDLLKNDEQTTYIERTKQSLRAALLGEV